ncbi:MAG: hypothetical protein LBE75_01195 [Burkholderiales bacterium]|jgi:uncharacterized repeat protein (TIGR02543 family)|nr:hypothetical protein [Burkholderiales bacterium]
MRLFTSPCLNRRASYLKRAAALLGLPLGLALFAASASAATITVNTIADATPADAANCAAGNPSTCRLRDAIAAAAASGDTIDFTAALAGSTITLTSTLTVDKSLTIDGAGASGLAVSGNNTIRVFTVTTGVIAEFANLIIKDGLLSGSAQGGGIYNAGTLTLTNSTVSGNSTYNGGGIYSAGTLTLTNSTVSGNTARYDGGGIYSAGALTLTNSTVSDNVADRLGGGIDVSGGTLSLTGSTVSGNSAYYGGGISRSGNGTATLTDSTVSGNSADVWGGGIFINNGAGDSLTLIRSAVFGNNSSYEGGGILNGSTLTLTDSTVSGNTADDYGGGISNYGTASLTNSTLSSNTAQYDGGGIYNDNGSLTLINTTMAGNTGGDLYNDAAPANARLTNTIAQSCAGNTVTDNGGNLDGGSNCGFTTVTSISNAVLDLGALANNGGPTLTMLPGASSAALARGLPSVCAASPVNGADQRGVARSATVCTSGAVEVDVTTLTVSVTGNGSVSTSPAWISGCTTSCAAFYVTGSSVTLTASPAAGYAFAGWGGACTGSSLTATVTMSAALTCTAQFTPQTITTTTVPTTDRWALLLLALLAAGVAFQRLESRKPF